MSGYTIGQNVQVRAFGRWYLGTVTKVGRTRVHVLYATGTGRQRVKAVLPAKVRALPGFTPAPLRAFVGVFDK